MWRVAVRGSVVCILVSASLVSTARGASALTGALEAWGYNNVGQLGIGSTDNRNVPVPVDSLTGVVAIASGDSHSLAVLSDGTVRAWGYNWYGQVGNGHEQQREVTAPVAVKKLRHVKAVAAGYNHSLALLTNGTVMAWGDNAYGESGDGTSGNVRTKPVPVAGLTHVKAISAGEFTSFALLKDGTVMAWGWNHEGELGIGTFSFHSDVPVAVHGLTGVKAVSAGAAHTLALLGDGTVAAWGSDDYGALGDGGTENQNLPIAVPGLTGVKTIAAGPFHNLVLLQNHTVKAWGYNGSGQVGVGRRQATNVPITIRTLRHVVAIAAGEELSLAIVNDGTVRAWGSNQRGELGDGTNTSSHVPVVVSGLSGVTAISAGAESAFALT